jgi:hypothetical protein
MKWNDIELRDLVYAKTKLDELTYQASLNIGKQDTHAHYRSDHVTTHAPYQTDPNDTNKTMFLSKTLEHYLRQGPTVGSRKLVHGGLNVHLWEKDALKHRELVQEDVLAKCGYDKQPMSILREQWSGSILPTSMYTRFAERAVNASTSGQVLVAKEQRPSHVDVADFIWDSSFKVEKKSK